MTTALHNAGASLAAIALASGENAVPFADMDDVALASAMAAETAAMAKALNEADTTVNGHGKAYGQRRAVLQFVRKVDAGSLDGADKAAIGFDNLPGSARSKRQLTKWHSDFRFIAERWQAPLVADASFIALSDDQRNGILAGSVSFLSVADKVRSDVRKAKAEADKAAKALETAVAAEAVKAEATPATLADMALALASALDKASDAERSEAGEAMALLLDTINAIYNVAEVEEVEAIAA